MNAMVSGLFVLRRQVRDCQEDVTINCSNRSAASLPMPGSRCEYTLCVIDGLAWPTRSDITFIGTPALIRRLMWVWRSLWKLTFKPRAAVFIRKTLLSVFGLMKLPSAVVHIRLYLLFQWPPADSLACAWCFL
jgi:hypothetical protein